MTEETKTITQDRAALVRPDDIFMWWDVMFKYADMVATPEHMIELRKIGHNPETGELFQESLTCQPWVASESFPEDSNANALRFLGQKILKAAEFGVGAFMAPALLNDRRATDHSVTHLMGVTVDLDTGDTEAKLRELLTMGLRPSLLVWSGGITDQGKKKVHVHYRLSEPCDEPWKVAHVRDLLAQKVGGDISFKRIPQVVRIPGSVHDKDKDNPRPVTILDCNPDAEHDLGDFADKLGIDWSNLQHGASGNLEFKDPVAQAERFKQIATTPIHEGGDGTDNRFIRLGEYIGHMIQTARIGKLTLDEAYRSVCVWNAENMKPPYEQDKIDDNFRALLARDRQNHADQWAAKEPKPIQITAPAAPAASDVTAPDKKVDPAAFSLSEHCEVDALLPGEPPPIDYLVENFMIANTTHALVADGGVGKTFTILDMALRLAIGPQLADGKQNYFLGFPVRQPCVCVVLTVEDTKDDIHRRIHSMDPSRELRGQTGKRLHIMPVKNIIPGGLTLVERDIRGNHKPSDRWLWVIERLKKLKAEHPEHPMVVVIDTYSATHHADENASVGTNEWFRAAGLLESECRAAVMVTHHVRKADPEAEIKTSAEFRNQIRGSGAFTANCRAVYGIWEIPNQEGIKKAGGCEPEAVLFNLGLVKTNTGIDWTDRAPGHKDPLVTLRRLGSGVLIYDGVTHQARLGMGDKRKENHKAAVVQLQAAVKTAVRYYAEAGYPLVARNLTHEYELYLPKEVHGVIGARDIIKAALSEWVANGTLIRTKLRKGRQVDVFDVPGGVYAIGQQYEKSDTVPMAPWTDYVYDQQAGEYVRRT